MNQLFSVTLLCFLVLSLGLRINCGGSALLGRDVLPDDPNYYQATKAPVKFYFSKEEASETTEFSTHSWTFKNITLVYDIPVEKSNKFNVRLYFAENWKGNFKKSSRVFDVLVNGKLVEADVDVWSKVGAYKPYSISVNDALPIGSKISIRVEPKKKNAMISAIDIKPSSASGPKRLKLKKQRTASSSADFVRVKSNYPLKVFEAAGTVLGGENGKKYLVVFGGYFKFPGVTREVHQLDLGNMNAKWERLADMPAKVTHVAQWTDGENTFCGVGGYDGDFPGTSGNSCFCFNRITNEFTRLPNLPGDRAGGGLVRIMRNGKKVFVYAGGVDRTMPSFREHIDYGTTWTLEYETNGAKWEKVKDDMPDPRNHMAAVESCGRYYFVGGQKKVDEQKGNSVTVSEFLVDSLTWKKQPPAPLPIPLGHVSASVIAYRCGIIVVGGITNGRKMSNAVFYYNSATNKWSQIASYPHKVATPVCGIVGDELVCATGGELNYQNRVFKGKIKLN